MSEPSLFAAAPEETQPTPRPGPAAPAATPRLRPVQRCQVEMRCASLDQLLPPEHDARLVWAYVEGVDIAPLLQGIKAVAGQPGRDANDPRVLLALWLFATCDGVGSARELDHLCQEHLAYQWLCGGLTVNYHSLSDFRKDHVSFLDQLLTDGVATLLHEGLIELQRVAQDGMKVRASAGASSFRREPSLQQCLAAAQEQVTALRSQVDEDRGAASRRQEAARQRAADDRCRRVQHALEQRQQLLALREQQKKDKGITFEPEQLRTSTTDPEARRMQMPDGGTRPGYNVQFATTTESGVIVGVAVTNSGGDGGQLGPMIEQLQGRYGTTPAEALVDGGFTTLADIEGVAAKHEVKVYGPIKDEDKKKAAGVDPYEPRRNDGPGVSAWRARMGTAEGQAIYQLRAQTAEWANAGARNRGLYQVRVRGLQRVLAVTLLHALVHNLLRARALRQANQAASAD
ncbi:MAG TPA: IS1182 family transposase [Gemmataceae bacterium]|jgi:transposase|nr:IS1182 family transposase [Gemmataceae bacterium]